MTTIKHYEDTEEMENVQTDFEVMENLALTGYELPTYDEKPEGSITHEEIQYAYGSFDDYTQIGLYRNSKGILERLYKAN
ncbi:hypothetical protein QK289_14255 [Exiguobacterium antarcticum]|uniref:Uncharacterized protein n=1 Tax=Exiguobacterium antarcticum TaxID=132920 RepID=A0ABT6R5R7_9BACL|nr:hypothetical protein [Exiguobacterium antarcticum]MDI3236173.1 hypothetical protein [Exiguobacterium antarcticum]